MDRNSVSPLSGEPGAVTQRGNGVLILPGRRIGKLALGVPVATYTRGVNRSFKTEYRGQDALQFRDELIVIVDKGYVARIVVLQSARVYFHTASGVAIGSAAGQVEEAYGHAQRIGNNGKQTDWLYPARGVRFTLTDGYVSEIEVFLPTLAR